MKKNHGMETGFGCNSYWGYGVFGGKSFHSSSIQGRNSEAIFKI
jgi:hypothetical protein